VEHGRQICYIVRMTTEFVPQTAPAPEPAETAEQREARIRRELALIAVAEARLDAGLGIDLDDLEAWFDQLDINENAPMPSARQQVR
jgi:hypothetical protein